MVAGNRNVIGTRLRRSSTQPVVRPWTTQGLAVLVDSTLRPEQVAEIEHLVASTASFGAGAGTRVEPCSIAAVNLALTGSLTDQIPSCMSGVVGTWVIWAQDAMPVSLRNSDEWRKLLPLAAGTGSAHEHERLAIVLDWMWAAVALAQDGADRIDAGRSWRAMRLFATRSWAERAAIAVRLGAEEHRVEQRHGAGPSLEALEAAQLDEQRRLAAAALHDAAHRVSVALDERFPVELRACAATRAGVSLVATFGASDAWERLDPVGTLIDLIAVAGRRPVLVNAGSEASAPFRTPVPR